MRTSQNLKRKLNMTIFETVICFHEGLDYKSSSSKVFR